MREIQTELFKGKEKEILISIFGGEQKLKEEYPALYEDMKTAQKQAGNRKEEGRTSSQDADFDGWEEFEKLKLFYDPKKKILTVNGKIHKSGGPDYLIAKLKVWNGQGKTWTFSYSVPQCSFLMIKENIQMEQDELSGIQAEINYMSSTIHPSSHAGYYPDAMPMSIKITFDPKTGKLYGGQIVGYDGVDKRIDEIALVIKHEGTIYDLMKVEQAYAPPFSSAKDPVAVAGYVAENIITGKVQPVYWRQLRDIEMENNFLLDVRTPDEFSLNTLPGAVNIPLDELRDRLDELPKDKMIYTFCAVGLRGYLAYRILVQHGFEKVRNLSGGLKTYHAAAAPIILREESENEVPAQPNANIQQPADAQPQKTVSPVEAVKTIRVDACGLQCPGPILKMKKTMDSLVSGDRVEITSTDPGFPRDAAAWCNSTGNQLISKETAGGKSVVVIEKGEPKSCNIVTSCEGKGKTFIMFSDDLDKALATFVLANGAAATGQKVTIFFTFWGLNVIKKLHKPNVEKDIFGKMFGMMLPSSSRKLKLSKMSMGGIGGKMMRYIMNRKGIDSLESLRQQALENGVEFIACQMSMDVMGVKQEELLDEVTIGGVATYMERADNANINLFI